MLTDNFRVYPNPFASHITINGEDEIHSIRIFDISGKVVEQIQVTEGKKQLEIQLDNLKSGIFFVQIESSGNTVIRKIIKH